MALTYQAIATVTVGSGGAANIEFTSIPGTYTDLLLKLSTRSTNASARTQLFVKYNDSSSNYTGRRLYGEDGGVSSDTLSGSTGYSFGITCGDTATANTFGSAEVYIPNYAGSNNKSSSTDSVIENNSSATYDNWLTANLWSDSSAITKISVTLSAGNFKQYSTATLYGIKNTV